LQRICGSSVSLARWVTASSAHIFVQCVNNWHLEGMTHAPTFNRATTHLLCPSATGAKYDKARLWGTPVVDMRWLSYIAKTGALPPRGTFLVIDSHAPDAETLDVDLVQEGWTTAPPQVVQPAIAPPPEATQPDADSPGREVSFGPRKLDPDQDEVVPSSSPTLPPASSPSSISHLPPSSLSAHPSLALSSRSSGKTPTQGGVTDDDEAAAFVPSSNTPSPLKLPQEQTDPAARALHESISNLLGKRNAGAMAIEDHAGTPPRRKRARPRSKVSQRRLECVILRSSHVRLQPVSAGANIGASVSNIHPPLVNIHTTSYAFGDEPGNGTSNMDAAPDHAMSPGLQAVYEDPTQAAERRKLISLLNGAPGRSRTRGERAHRAAPTSHNAPPGGRMAGF
jgi:DNA replication regulator DPB11